MAETTDADLLPCPFCGGASVPTMAMNMQGTRFYRQCNNCNMQGPDDSTREGRDAAWNTRAAPTVPDGWVLVPREPTATMLAAAGYADATEEGKDYIRFRYTAMLSAAPKVQP